MRIHVLPNLYKKLGLFLFIIGSIVGGGDDFIDGFTGTPYNESVGAITIFVGGEVVIHIFNIIAIVGMLIYMLSKEKIEDDYINILRLESFQLTSIIGLSFTILVFSFSKDLKLTLDYFIILFVWIYLIVFFVKKRIDL